MYMKDVESAEVENKCFKCKKKKGMVVFGHFHSKNCQFSMNFHDKSKNKNRTKDFSFDSAHCASFMKVRSKLRGGFV